MDLNKCNLDKELLKERVLYCSNLLNDPRRIFTYHYTPFGFVCMGLILRVTCDNFEATLHAKSHKYLIAISLSNDNMYRQRNKQWLSSWLQPSYSIYQPSYSISYYGESLFYLELLSIHFLHTVFRWRFSWYHLLTGTAEAN